MTNYKKKNFKYWKKNFDRFLDQKGTINLLEEQYTLSEALFKIDPIKYQEMLTDWYKIENKEELDRIKKRDSELVNEMENFKGYEQEYKCAYHIKGNYE